MSVRALLPWRWAPAVNQLHPDRTKAPPLSAETRLPPGLCGGGFIKLQDDEPKRIKTLEN